MSTRREFLKGAATTTAGLCFTGCGLAAYAFGAQRQPAVRNKRREVSVGGRRVRTVDVHCHCYIRDVWELIKDHPQAKSLQGVLDTPDGKNLNIENLSYRLQQMDEQGIDIQAVSLGTTYLYLWAEEDLAREVMKVQNEKIAALCAAHPDRFVGMAGISLQHPDLAARQLEECTKKLGMRGCMVAANVNGEELASPRFHPFWAKAEELGTLVFIHPSGVPEADRRFQGKGRLGNVIGNPLDTTIALSHLIFEGTLNRFPGVKICAAHAGGFLGSYAGRSDHCYEVDSACKSIQKRPSDYLRQLYFDSVVFNSEAIRHVAAEVGAGQLVLGTDFPYIMGDPKAVDVVLGTAGLNDTEKAAILGGTLAKLLGIASPSQK
jgi:predicted TIM-barrel fold metal-dependent hydrolase